MAPFDPYYNWLGIPPDDQPPHHYRLLGLNLFESNLDVIDAAANRQMAFVKQAAAGPHGTHSETILNQIANARLCLLKPAAKAAYDSELKKTVASGAPPQLQLEDSGLPKTPGTRSIAYRRGIAGAIVAGVVAIAAAVTLFPGTDSPNAARKKPSFRSSKARAPVEIAQDSTPPAAEAELDIVDADSVQAESDGGESSGQPLVPVQSSEADDNVEGDLVASDEAPQPPESERSAGLPDTTTRQGEPAETQQAPADNTRASFQLVLDKAKEDYANAGEELRRAVKKHLDDREAKARKVGSKKQLDEIKADRQAYEQLGVIPKGVPKKPSQQVETARSTLMKDYETAIKEYTKARRDDEASAAERELEDLKFPWVQIFNGKDLHGWKKHAADKSNWTVKDGVLTGTGGYGYLFSERSYTNCRIRVEGNINVGGNGGLFFRSQHFHEPAGFGHAGYEAQIAPDATGDLLMFDGPTNLRPVIQASRHVPGNVWFVMEVSANGNVITVSLNGRPVLTHQDLVRPYASGQIALQIQRGTIQFRKIAVAVLKKEP